MDCLLCEIFFETTFFANSPWYLKVDLMETGKRMVRARGGVCQTRARIFKPKNRFQGTNSDRLCSLAGRFLAPINDLKIPASNSNNFINFILLLNPLKNLY